MPRAKKESDSFLHTFPDGEIRRYTPKEVDVAYMLTFFGKFGNFPAQEQIPPASDLIKFDLELALTAAQRKRDNGNEDHSNSPPIKGPPITLGDLTICDICGLELADASSLSRHKKRHDKDSKVFVCGVCQKGHRQRTNWKIHVITHIGEEIPPDIWNRLDDTTKALVSAKDKFVTEDLLKKRLAIAANKKKRRRKVKVG